MKTGSKLGLCCGFALLSLALTGQARADQELSVTYDKWTTSFNDWIFQGWATCQGVPTPWNCTNSSDQVGYWVKGNWSDGAAYAQGVVGDQVSAGDTAFVQIALYCDDGSWGHNYYTGSGPDGGNPPSYAYSWCYTSSGNYGTSYQVTFTYGVATTGAS